MKTLNAQHWLVITGLIGGVVHNAVAAWASGGGYTPIIQAVGLSATTAILGIVGLYTEAPKAAPAVTVAAVKVSA